MKRKISYILCVLTLVLGLTGCSEQKAIAYDEESLTYSCEQMFALISSGQIPADEIQSMSEWNQGYLMAQIEGQTGIQISSENFVTAIQGFEAAEEECGTYIGHGDYEFEAKSTGLTVTTEAEFSERTADLEFTFDENMEMESFTVSAKFSLGEIMEKAGLNTLLGMGTVFAVLIFMSLLISLFKYIPLLLNKENKNKKEETADKELLEQPVNDVTEPEMDETELVAVIAAAIAAYEGTTTDGFVVRSIKRRKSNKWNA